MEKLELMHLVAYAPYQVKISINVKENNQGQKYPVDLLGYEIVSPGNVVLKVFDNGIKLPFNINLVDVKLVLRPLFDFFDAPIDFKNEVGDYIKKHIAIAVFDYYYKFKNFNVDTWPRGLVEIFIKHHFDVFGLIEKALAIDINTVK